MRKKLVSLAVLAGLTAGMGSAQAVYVNSDGLGQVLMYPFYSTEGGNDTYVAIANTTDTFKAVKVRILEAMDSQEVLDFNLYLSPRDHWSAVITASANGATIQTGDTSCTVPNALAATVVDGEVVAGPAVEFRDLEYAPNGGTARTREGYIEIIEMGEIEDVDFENAIEHVDGQPGDCAYLQTAWEAGGRWDVADDDGLVAAGGGLYGYGVIINVAAGTDASYDAVALDSFFGLAPVHTDPGSLAPSLANADPIAAVIDGTTIFNADFIGTTPSAGINAVSAVLMHDSIMNDYVLEPDINAGTDWVITFPTKRDYVAADDVNAPYLPFSTTFGYPNGACEEITIDYWNREEAFVQVDPEGLDFSPKPPPAVAPALSLCFEANVLTFNASDVLSASDRVRRNLEVNFDNGWAEIGFDVDNSGLAGGDFDAAAERVLIGADLDNALNSVVFKGLPVVGFAVQNYVNGTLEGGVLSNYAGSVTHKATRDITSQVTP